MLRINLAVLLVMLIAPCLFADDWQQIKLSDSRVAACHAEWHLVFTQFPTTSPTDGTQPDYAKLYTESLDRYQRQGMSISQAESMAHNDMAQIHQDILGFEIPQYLIYEWNGKNYLAMDQYGPTQVNGSSSNSDLPINHYVTQTRESFDGQNYMQLEHSVPLGINPSNSPFVGTVYRGEKFGHSHSFGAWPGTARGGAIFLFGKPVSDVFNASNSKLSRVSNQSAVIEQHVAGNDSSQHYVIKATISTQYWRPVEVDIISENTQKL